MESVWYYVMYCMSKHIVPSERGMAAGRFLSVKRWCDRIADMALYALIILLPLFFCTWTMDALELPKQLLLVGVTGVMSLAWVGSMVAERQARISRGWMHAVVVVFGLFTLVASVLAVNRGQAFFGVSGQVSFAFLTILALILMYVVMANRVRKIATVYHILFASLVSALVLGIFSLLQLFGFIAIPGLGTLTSVGSVFSTAIYLTVSAVIAAAITVHGCREKMCLLGAENLSGTMSRGVVWLSLLMSVAYLVVVDYWVSWVVLLIASVMMVGAGYFRTRRIGSLFSLILPGLLTLVSIFFLLWPSLSLLFPAFPSYVAVPGEVAPSAGASWQVAKATMQAHPVFGSGPSTWATDYAMYRSAGVNLSPYWNVRFDRGFSTFFTLLATTGMAGTVAWLLLIGSGIVLSVMHLLREQEDEVWYAYLTVFTGWVSLVLVSFFYNFGLAHQVLFWMLLGLLGAMMSQADFVWDAKAKPVFQSILTVKWMVLLVAMISGVWVLGQRYVSQVAFAQGIAMFKEDKPIEGTIATLEEAMRLQPASDVLARNLSQAYLVQVGRLMATRPTPQEFEVKVQPSLKKMFELAELATRLAPEQGENWANAGQVYAAVSGVLVKDAAAKAIGFYEEAYKREPANPVYVMELGKLYVLQADDYRELTQSKDEAQQKTAAEQMNIALEKARVTLQRSVQLKADYFPARYFLGLAYERQGKVGEAVKELEQVLSQNPTDADVAFELAILYYRDQQKERALKLMEEVVRVQPDRANARWYLASMYEEKGMITEAVVQLQTLEKQAPENQSVKQRLMLLRDRRQVPAGLPDPLGEGIDPTNSLR